MSPTILHGFSTTRGLRTVSTSRIENPFFHNWQRLTEPGRQGADGMSIAPSPRHEMLAPLTYRVASDLPAAGGHACCACDRDSVRSLIPELPRSTHQFDSER